MNRFDAGESYAQDKLKKTHLDDKVDIYVGRNITTRNQSRQREEKSLFFVSSFDASRFPGAGVFEIFSKH